MLTTLSKIEGQAMGLYVTGSFNPFKKFKSFKT